MLRQLIRKYLREAVSEPHFIERLNDRFLTPHVFTVGYEEKNNSSVYNIVGKFELTPELLHVLTQRLTIIQSLNFPKQKSYGIKIIDIPIDKQSVNYYTPEDKKSALQARVPLVITNLNTSESNGNSIWVIIRENRIKTIMLVKNYLKITPDKIKTDFVISNWDVILNKKY